MNGSINRENPNSSTHFIREIVRQDLNDGRIAKVITRFPPEPNGYLHLGHAKSICLNFGIAMEFGGRCHLRFDDTNPTQEKQEFISSIQEDVSWLGYNWGDKTYYASDNFLQLYEWAVYLVKKGKAYVDHLDANEIRAFRGTLQKPGKNSPYRDRSVRENLDLFARMKAGEFKDGSCVLRAKIDMAAGNINLRDPVIYRIMSVSHPRTGMEWCIYPSYDFAHGQSDSIEGITHSICTLEFEDHRPLYDWFISNLPVPTSPRQYEFSRLNLSYTILSKRKLKRIVEEGYVNGWDDPRMPTLSGLRRRGIPSEAIRDFAQRIGVTKSDVTIEIEYFEHCAREHLNKSAERRMAVLRPLKVVIENYPTEKSEKFKAINNPESSLAGTREVVFSREIFIEETDFMLEPPKKFYRLSPGSEVKLRYAYIIKCTEVIKNRNGEVIELRCSYDPESLGKNVSSGKKVKAILHWVSAKHSIDATVNLYEQLFSDPFPEKDGEDFLRRINKNSLEILRNCKLEPSLGKIPKNQTVQFERLGYFCKDTSSTSEALTFNRALSLRDSWAKIQLKNAKSK